MAASPVVCAYCGGPLPQELGVVECPYCHRPNNPSGLPAKHELRGVVRDVVAEDENGDGVPDVLQSHLRRAPAPQSVDSIVRGAAPRKNLTGLWLGLGLMTMLLTGVVVFLLASGGPISASQVRVNPNKPAAPPATKFGPPKRMSFLENGDVIVMTDKQLVRAEPKTLVRLWAAPFEADTYSMVFEHGKSLIVFTRLGAHYFNIDTGESLGKYLFDSDIHSVQGACLTDDGQLVITMPFKDAPLRLSGIAPTKVAGTSKCELIEAHREQCSKDLPCIRVKKSAEDMSCDYAIQQDKQMFASCNMEDGTRRQAVVRFGDNGQPIWTSFRAAEDASSVRTLYLDNGVLVVGMLLGSLEVYDAESGELRWKSPKSSNSAPVVVQDGVVYWGDKDVLRASNVKTGDSLATLDAAPNKADVPLAEAPDPTQP